MHFFKRYQTLLLLILVGIAHFSVDIMLGIWPIYKSMAQIDLATAGLVVALGAFIGEGSQIIFGTLGDRGYRKIILIIGLLAAVGSAFLVYSQHYVVLFGLYLMTCIGSGCFHPSAAGLVSNLYPVRRNLMMSIFALGGSLGLAFSQLIFTSTYHFFEGHTFILIVPAIVITLFLIFYPFPATKPLMVKKIAIKDTFKFFKQSTLRNLYFTQVANQSVLWATIFILPDCLKDLGYSGWITQGGGHLCFILGGTFMMIPAGYLADMFSARQVMLISGIASCFLFYFILYFGGLSLYVLLPALFLLGSCLFIINPIGLALGTKLVPDQPGAISAFLMGMVWCVSEALGPGGVGLLTTLFDSHAPTKALAILGYFFFIQIYATVRLPKQSTQELLEAV